MFKRNDGYALSYVLVVLLVLAIIATAVMAPPLRNLQLQQASIERMQDKYAAQGMIEQVVAQLHTSGSISSESGNPTVTFNETEKKCTVKAKNGNTIIDAVIKVTDNTTDPPTYTINYESYEISYNTEVGS